MNGETVRTRLSPAAVVAGLILVLDAITCQLLALIMVLPTISTVWGPDGEPDRLTTVAAQLTAAAVLALWCPAAAVLVVGVRTRAARLTGLTTAAVLVVAAAALAAAGMGSGTVANAMLTVGAVAALLNIAAVGLLVTPGPARGPVPAEPPRTIDLGAA